MPGMYTMASPIAVAIASAARPGLSCCPAIERAISATSGCGSVRPDCPSISTVSIARRLSRARRSQLISGNSIGRGRTSTSERAVMSSALCPASTSNAATRVPK